MKKNYLFILGITLLILMFIISFFLFNKKNWEISITLNTNTWVTLDLPSNLKDCEKYWETAEKYICISRINYEKEYYIVDNLRDISFCYNIESEKFEDEIIKDCKKTIPFDLAILSENPSLCDDVDDERMKSMCKLRLSYADIFKHQFYPWESYVCNDIPELDEEHKWLKEFCFQLMDDLAPVFRAAVCEEEVNVESCDLLDPKRKVNCEKRVESTEMRRLAMENLDTSYCDSMEDFVEVQICTSRVNAFKKILEKWDIEECKYAWLCERSENFCKKYMKEGFILY